MIDHWSVFIPQLGCKNVPTNNTLATPTMAINISKITSAMKKHMLHTHTSFRSIPGICGIPTFLAADLQFGPAKAHLQRFPKSLVVHGMSPWISSGWWWHSSGEFLFALPWVSQHLLRHGLYSATKQAIMTFSTVEGALKHSFPCSLQAYHPTGMNQIKEVYYIYNKQSYVRKLVISLAWTATIDTLFRELVYIEYHEEWPFDGIRLHVTSVHRKQTRMPSLWL